MHQAFFCKACLSSPCLRTFTRHGKSSFNEVMAGRHPHKSRLRIGLPEEFPGGAVPSSAFVPLGPLEEEEEE